MRRKNFEVTELNFGEKYQREESEIETGCLGDGFGENYQREESEIESTEYCLGDGIGEKYQRESNE